MSCSGSPGCWWVALLVLLGRSRYHRSDRYTSTMPSAGSPCSTPRRVVGRKMYGGQSTHLPMKVNMSGVMPIIFAQSIALPSPRPSRLLAPGKTDGFGTASFGSSTPSALRCMRSYFLLIIFFAYFYVDHPVQSHRGCQQPEEERRLHPRLPSRQADQRVHPEGAQQDHSVRCYLSGHHRHRAHPHRPLQSVPPPSRGISLGGTSDHHRCRRCA